MQVIPAINANTAVEAEEQIRKIIPFTNLVHIDICDGEFTQAITWGTPEEVKALAIRYKLNVEVHLMVENPEVIIDGWIKNGFKRFVIHNSAVSDKSILLKAVKSGAEIYLSVGPIDKIESLADFNAFQVLSVPPGFAGQKFDEEAIERIKSLRVKYPNAKIEVDGGINPHTAKRVKEAGADIVISASYILESADPKAAYEELAAV